MDDSVKIKPKTFNSNSLDSNLSNKDYDLNAEVNKYLAAIENLNKSEKDIIFPDIVNDLLEAELTDINYEIIFMLNKYQAVELPPSSYTTRNISYKDSDGITMAKVQIDSKTNKIKIQAFGNIFPKQKFTTPQNVGQRVLNSAIISNWTTEDGGINQFDGNIEIRYKDHDGNVMAAVITKPDGKTIDTIVEYQYKEKKKFSMLHTNQYGQSITIYDCSKDTSQIMCIEIDTDGCIYCITKSFLPTK